MASTGSTGNALPHNFILTPHQQSLLFAALHANKQGSTISPGVKSESLQESTYLDNFDDDLGDTSFEFSFASAGGDQNTMMGGIPSTGNSDCAEGETHEKRSYPDDDDGETSPGNESKRHESTGKVAKKPGRKPLTSEPTSKRKAQNRAAQRAFRERKEKHLKDLESKVEELEKASQDANHENSKLRAQVDKMTVELNQYKQRLAVMAPKSGSRDKMLYDMNDVSFQFEFPQFGALPTPPTSTACPASNPVSPEQSNQNGQKKTSVCSLGASATTGTASRCSLDLGAATSSPSVSSNSNAEGPGSSCGTSPEPLMQSPTAFKPIETLTTIGEEQPESTMANQPFALGDLDVGSPSFDWLVQQNGGGSFDPQLFGDYRDSQENVLSNPSFDDFVFGGALDADFYTPFNTAPTLGPKKDLIAEIDAQRNAIENDESKETGLSCTQLWYVLKNRTNCRYEQSLTSGYREKIQGCSNAQTGSFDFDLDGLCSELTKKAKCTGSGPVVCPDDFDSILKKYMHKTDKPNDGVATL
ncbi:hypothetical protein E4U12_006121 [Claviceps purpurea]|nr:hypothetical protein E4U12_006121 [Claviceps purpurea]